VEEFTIGIECGQICFVEDARSISIESLFTLFAGTIESDDPRAYSIGFLLGYAEAFFRNRKLASFVFWRRAKNVGQQRTPRGR
jgi:hypothetical protein